LAGTVCARSGVATAAIVEIATRAMVNFFIFFSSDLG
jgi:hypothetical protein